MSSYTYPIASPVGTLTTTQIHTLLASPRIVSRRLATLMDNKFVADFILQGRYEAKGGSILYETGESIFADDDPEAIAPGAEYPRTLVTRGDIVSAPTTKWGVETELTDESISRQGMQIVDRVFGRLANSVVRHVDSVSWGVIGSRVSSTIESAAPWDSVNSVITSLLEARAKKEDLDLGINLDTVALSPMEYARVMGMFLNAGVLPRENNNPILSGEIPPSLLGWQWVVSKHVVGSNPWVFDRTLLGGMADEDINSPGYTRSGNVGVEVAIERVGNRDAYLPRARRVTVPIVTEPLAGAQLTGTKPVEGP